MPTYDYQCDACGHRFGERQSFSDPPLTKCPECKKNKLERLFGSGGAVIFKGAGFYETDYRRAGQPAETSEPAKPETTEVKPDAKPESPKPATDGSAKGESKSTGISKKKGK
ncbi:MAG: zinc ribbon domain-containing protein [Planctomycetia bacterium]|nr:zinc ribbon domain-containing protein [Planctomycetia bacterium]MCI0702948.1 zinc ribbon domain-containing protein [Planctomycetia bacterium]